MTVLTVTTSLENVTFNLIVEDVVKGVADSQPAGIAEFLRQLSIAFSDRVKDRSKMDQHRDRIAEVSEGIDQVRETLIRSL